MCKVIQFPNRESNGYKNLVAFFAICDTVESCNFYLESAEYLFEQGNISQRELYTLRRIGRQKRLELAAPEKKAPEKAEKPGTYIYTPEMGEEKPDCQIDASLGHYGTHYYLDTPLELKGRGITFLKKYEAKDFCRPSHKIGWNQYRVTNKAFEKIKKSYSVSMKSLLD